MKKLVRNTLSAVFALALTLSASAGIAAIDYDTNAASNAVTAAAETQFTAVNTSVNGVSYCCGSHIVFRLSENDYPTESSNTNSIAQTAYEEYDFLEKIIFEDALGSQYTLKTIMRTAANGGEVMYSHAVGGIAIKVESNYRPLITKVTIPAGTQFPSYEYAVNGTGSNAYVTTEEIVYEGSNSVANWTKVEAGFTAVDTAVDGVSYCCGSHIAFKLSENDYPTESSNTNSIAQTAYEEYNFLEKIIFEDALGTEYTLKTIMRTAANGGEVMYSHKVGGITIKVESNYRPLIAKVTVPEGTEFPSYEYITSGTGEKAYVTTKEVVYEGSNNVADWTIVGEVGGGDETPSDIVEVESDVQTVKLLNGRHLAFILTKSDYVIDSMKTAGEGYKEFNFLTNIRVTISKDGTDTVKSLGEAMQIEGGEVLFRLTSGAISVKFPADTSEYITKVEIPTGTQFPSYAYCNGGAEVKSAWVTKNTLSLVKTSFGSYVTEDVVTNALEGDQGYREVTGAMFNVSGGVGDGADNYLELWVAGTDYGQAAENNNNMDANPIYNVTTPSLNTLDKIKVNGKIVSDILKDGVGGTVPEGMNNDSVLFQTYCNLWQRWETFNVRLSGMSYAEEITEVVIEAGCQFPTMSYIKTGVPSWYTVENDTYYRDNEGTLSKSYKVTFKADAEDEGEVVWAYSNYTITAPEFTKEGYYVSAWLDEDGIEWSFENDHVISHMTLTAQWMEDTTPDTGTSVDSGNTSVKDETDSSSVSTSSGSGLGVGCFGSVSGCGIAMFTILGAAIVVSKKKRNK